MIIEPRAHSHCPYKIWDIAPPLYDTSKITNNREKKQRKTIREMFTQIVEVWHVFEIF